MLKKLVVGGIFVIGLIVFGFIMLLRSCLSKYDERSVISTPQVIEKNGNTIVFSIVKFDKTTSYSQNGGFIRKSVSSSYYLQTNDAITGEKLQSKKIKTHSEIKWFPVEILGVSNNIVWLFAGELIAFDPFTLEKLADKEVLNAKNPSLLGRFPDDPRYYEFDKRKGFIRIILKDASLYTLDLATMIATPAEKIAVEPEEFIKKELDDLMDTLRKLSDSNYTRFRIANRLYSERKITARAYKDSSDRFERERSRISKQEESIRQTAQRQLDGFEAMQEEQRLGEIFRSSTSFSQINVNTDSFNKKWYGLGEEDDLRNLPVEFAYRKVYGDVSRNKLFSGELKQKDTSHKYSKWMIARDKKNLSEQVYLQGGFLLAMETGKPVHLLDPGGFLVVSKSEVGTEGKIVLSRVGIDGKQSWSSNTGLKDFSYWTIKGNRIYIFGTDNKELSSAEINVMHIIDLDSGKMITHDFFNDKNRKN